MTRRTRPLAVATAVTLALVVGTGLSAGGAGPASAAGRKVAQEPLVVSTTEGTFGVVLALETTGGSGDGEVSFEAVDGTASGCQAIGNALISMSAGSCIVTATKAASGEYDAATSSPTPVHLLDDQESLAITSGVGRIGKPLLLTVSGGSGDGEVTFEAVDGTGYGCRISATAPYRLSATRAGTCTVTATKAGDDSYRATSSAPSDVTMLAAVPGPVRRLVVAGAAGAARRTITWSAPLSDGGQRVTYRLEVRTASKALLLGRTVRGTRYVLDRAAVKSGRLTAVVLAHNSAGFGRPVSASFRVS